MVTLDEWAFTEPLQSEQRVALREAFPWGRGRGMTIADPRLGKPGTLVGIRGSFGLHMVVPGGERIATSALSWVGVHPGHRRRGILRSMMHDHFARSIERGEYVSSLFAAEPQIYQRFGYGRAAWHVRATFGRGAELREVPGTTDLTVRLERLSHEAHSELMSTVQRQVTRPGAMVRDSEPLAREMTASEVNDRPSEERLKIAIVSNPAGEPVAYALFRRRVKWEGYSADGTVTVNEFVTTTGAASRRLWGVLLDLDLSSRVLVTCLPLDDRLMMLALDQRSPKPVIEDDLWLRILDVRRALEARTYARPIDLVVGVSDAQLPANQGLWRIATEPWKATEMEPPSNSFTTGAAARHDGAFVARVSKVADSDREPIRVDIRLGIQELSGAYLGGVTIESLTEAGLIEEHTPGASRLLSAAMQSAQAPMSSFQF